MALSAGNINLSCMFESALGEKVPNSHFCGTEPISTMFGSPGLVQGHAMCYPHWYGIGDHRVFILEVSADSLYGGDMPTIVTPAARQSNCKISHIREKYCSSLKTLVTRHKMKEKQAILKNSDSIYLGNKYNISMTNGTWRWESSCPLQKTAVISS